MKQEHKLVAELYRYLAPFIDAKHPVYISLDGQAATTGVKEGTFSDSTVPDLWFTLLAATAKTLIEAKTIDKRGRALLMQSQLQAWRSNGNGAHKPTFWVATNLAFDRFYFWSHTEFLPMLDKTTAKANTLTLQPPKSQRKFLSVDALALYILRQVQPYPRRFSCCRRCHGPAHRQRWQRHDCVHRTASRGSAVGTYGRLQCFHRPAIACR